MNSAFISNGQILRVDHHFQSTNAMICGDVHIGDDCSFWFGSVVRGDVAPIRLGKRVNVQDGAVLHCDSGEPLEIEGEVTIGHGAVVHCLRVGAGSLIGIKAVILGKCIIGKECLIAAGAVLSPGTVVPAGHVVMGVPGKVIRPLRPTEHEHLKWNNQHYVELAAEHVRHPEKFYRAHPTS